MTTELPVLNVDLLRQVMAQIEAHPETWNQGNWFRRSDCGTTACFAGWTCQLTGWEPVYEDEDMPVTGHVERKGAIPALHPHVHEVAVKELGITVAEASRLFFAPTDFATLQDLVEQIIDGVYRPQAVV